MAKKKLVRKTRAKPKSESDPKGESSMTKPAAKKKSISRKTSSSRSVKPKQSPKRRVVPSAIAKIGGSAASEAIIDDAQAAVEFETRMVELRSQYGRAKKVLEKWKDQIFSDEWQRKFGRITSANVQFRTKYGRKVSPLRYVINIRVTKKLTPTELEGCQRECIPPTLDRVPVKVSEGEADYAMSNGSFAAGSDQPNNPEPLTNDLVGGVPIAPTTAQNAWGTLGVCVKDSSAKTFGITNFHVAQNVSRDLSQLGPQTAIPTSIGIGKCKRGLQGEFLPSYGAFGVDCASVELAVSGGRNISDKIRGWKPTWTPPILFPLAQRLADFSDVLGRVFVFGAKTGALREGRLDDVDFDHLHIGPKEFNQLIAVNRTSGTFIQPGDSGSIVLLEVLVGGVLRVLAIGVIFARDNSDLRIGYACHMRPVLDQLSISLPGAVLVNNWSTPK